MDSGFSLEYGLGWRWVSNDSLVTWFRFRFGNRVDLSALSCVGGVYFEFLVSVWGGRSVAVAAIPAWMGLSMEDKLHLCFYAVSANGRYVYVYPRGLLGVSTDIKPIEPDRIIGILAERFALTGGVLPDVVSGFDALNDDAIHHIAFGEKNGRGFPISGRNLSG